MTGLHLVDVIIVVLVAGSVLGAVRQRRGLLAALASGVGTALVCWLVAAAVLAWAPPLARSTVASSQLLRMVPPPVAAADQAGRLGARLIHQLHLSDSASPSS